MQTVEGSNSNKSSYEFKAGQTAFDLLKSTHGDFQSSYYCLSVILKKPLAEKRFEIIHYLQSRGIARESARFMMIEGFADEILEDVSYEPLKIRLTGLVRKKIEKICHSRNPCLPAGRFRRESRCL